LLAFCDYGVVPVTAAQGGGDPSDDPTPSEPEPTPPLAVGDTFLSEYELFQFGVTSIDPREVSVQNNRFTGGELVFPDSVKGPDGRTYTVTSIEAHGFYFYDGFIDVLTIPNSVKTIGEFAFFRGWGIGGNLIIPDSVTTIGYMAFYYCNFQSMEFYLTDLSGVDPDAFDYLLDIPVRCPKGYRDVYEAYGFTNITDDL
jgi:hypothetical protein